jgi:15-cis-phytoene synthase
LTVSDPARDEVVRLAARATAPDFYLTALLAPVDVRRDLVALAAVFGDVDRIVATVSDPHLAEIRLQWWREALSAALEGTLCGHPIADAAGIAMRRHALPLAEFEGLLEARAFDVYADAMPDEAGLLAYLDRSDGGQFRLLARVVGADPVSPPIGLAALAYGQARLLRHLPRFVHRGHAPFPQVDSHDGVALHAEISRRLDHATRQLALAGAAFRGADRATRLACLPLAVVAPYLSAYRQLGVEQSRAICDIQPIIRIWRMWLAHTLGRV